MILSTSYRREGERNEGREREGKKRGEGTGEGYRIGNPRGLNLWLKFTVTPLYSDILLQYSGSYIHTVANEQQHNYMAITILIVIVLFMVMKILLMIMVMNC